MTALDPDPIYTELAAATAPPPATHRLTVTIIPGAGVEYRVTCTAPPGGLCRLTCEGAVRGVCDDSCDDSCDGSIVDGGQCLPVSWLDGGDAAALLGAYDGPARPFASGPILVRYSRPSAEWVWIYPEDVPARWTPERWARVTI